MDQSISDAAHSVGCSDYVTWLVAPDHFAKPLMGAAKRYARFLKESALVKSHNEGLETVAKAAGFPHWHAFHSIVQGLLNALDPEGNWPRSEDGREPFKPLVPAFVFMVQAPPDCPPTPAQQLGLTKAATQLAQACDSQLDPILDMIGRMNGADSWGKLLTRKPEEAKGPLYGFQVDEDGNGQFVISSACAALIDEQDELFQGFNSRPQSQQREFEIQLARVLEARPDFLEGLLAKAEVLSFKPGLLNRQGKIYADAIKRANQLIPVGFKGEIAWGYLNNRFYHRLLYAAMVWHSHKGHTAKAVALARRQLRLNRADNLGVRLWLPILLVADGQATAADKASMKMNPDDDCTDAGIELVNAICHYANGRLQQSAEALYLSVFMYPPVRHVISVDFAALDESANDRQSSRTIIPDAQTMLSQYVSVAMQLETLELTFERWLRRPSVALDESALAQEFHANWRQSNGTLDKWHAELKRRASLLSKAATIS